MKKILFLILLLTSPAFAQDVTFDSAATGTTDTTSPATVDITVGSNSDRALLVCASTSADAGDSIASVSWNGGAQTGTLVVGSGDATDVRTELWIVKNPDTGTHTLTVTENISTGSFFIGVISLYNVHQTTSTASPQSQDVTSGTSLSLTPTTVAGDMAVDCWSSRFPITTSGTTSGAGQTTRIDWASVGISILMGSTEAATGSSTAMTWTLSQNEATYVALNHVAVAVKKVASATATAGSTLRRRRN